MKPSSTPPLDPQPKDILQKNYPHNQPSHPQQAHPQATPAKRRRLFLPWFDIPVLLLLLSAVLTWSWTRHNSNKHPLRFPRQQSEFRSAADLEKAKIDAQAVTLKDPDNIDAWVDLALIDFESGQDNYVEGLENLEHARDLGALDDRLFYYAGVMYEAEGLEDYARPEYERFLRHHPDDQEVRLRLGNLYYHTDDLDHAIEQYEKVLQARPFDPLVSFNLAQAYLDKERWQDGIRVLDESVKAGKTLPAGDQKLYGDLYRGAGDVAKAMEHYNLALSQQKDDADLWESVALANEDAKDYAQALIGWKRVLELNPKHKKAKDKIRQMQRKVKSQS